MQNPLVAYFAPLVLQDPQDDEAVELLPPQEWLHTVNPISGFMFTTDYAVVLWWDDLGVAPSDELQVLPWYI